MRKIYVEPLWRLPASYRYLIDYPPTGYQFVRRESAQTRVFTMLSRRRLAYRIQWLIDGVIPVGLAKSWIDRWRRPPKDAALTYAHGHLVLRQEPWVAEVEYASLLLEDHPKFVLLLRHLLENLLASECCRGIRCWSRAGMRTLTEGLRSDGFAHKIALIPPAIPSRRTFVKKPDGEVIRILFVGSGNIKGQFDVKGGREVLETFLHLRRRYSGIELVVRSDVPPDVRSKFTGVEGLRLIEDGISSEQIEREYQASDIFLLPSHSTPPFTFLDAMSFELPVVSIDTWANGEFIVDGATGLLARRSQRIPYSFRGTLHPNFGTGRFAEAVRHVDERVIGDLVEKAGLLIENADLRRSLGRQARWEVEHGRFSIGERNRRLGRFFELALHDRTSGADKGPLL